MLLMVDNYDSFTYNVVQYFGELKADVKVVRNDEVSVADIEAEDPAYVVISPGPCTPNEAGISLEAVKYFSGKRPIIGYLFWGIKVSVRHLAVVLYVHHK